MGQPDYEKASINITEKPSYKIIEPDAEFSIAIVTEIELWIL